MKSPIVLSEVTEEKIEESWSKWGDGTPLKPGFAKWLSAELNKPYDFRRGMYGDNLRPMSMNLAMCVIPAHSQMWDWVPGKGRVLRQPVIKPLVQYFEKTSTHIRVTVDCSDHLTAHGPKRLEHTSGDDEWPSTPESLLELVIKESTCGPDVDTSDRSRYANYTQITYVMGEHL